MNRSRVIAGAAGIIAIPAVILAPRPAHAAVAPAGQNPFPVTFFAGGYSYTANFDVGGPTHCPQDCNRCNEAEALFRKSLNAVSPSIVGALAITGVAWPPASAVVWTVPPNATGVQTFIKNLTSRVS